METSYSDNWGPVEDEDVSKLEGPILIFGVSGFIGVNLFLSLTRRRDDVFGCSRKGHINERPGRNLFSIDITDPDQIKNIISEIKPKTIFNLTGLRTSDTESEIEAIYKVNYLGALNVLEASKTVNCRAVVQAGSSSEYGQNSAGPKEESPLMPNSHYSVSKIGASYLAKYYGLNLLPVMHLRLYSVYGPREDRKHFIPAIITAGLKNQWPLLVGGTVSHDFVYVDDCTSAFVKAALCLYKGDGFGSSVNIATGIKTTTKDLVNETKEILKITEKPKFGSMPNKKWDSSEWYGNPALAGRLLKWHYRTSLAEGLRRVADWERSETNGVKNLSKESQI